MAKNNYPDFWEPTACLSREQILSYLEGQVNPQLSHQIEAHVLNCPLCEAALEGLQGSKQPALTEAWQDLEQRFTEKSASRIHSTIHQSQPAEKGRSGKSGRHHLLRWVAAASILICVSGGAYWLLRQQQPTESLANQINIPELEDSVAGITQPEMVIKTPKISSERVLDTLSHSPGLMPNSSIKHITPAPTQVTVTSADESPVTESNADPVTDNLESLYRSKEEDVAEVPPVEDKESVKQLNREKVQKEQIDEKIVKDQVSPVHLSKKSAVGMNANRNAPVIQNSRDLGYSSNQNNAAAASGATQSDMQKTSWESAYQTGVNLFNRKEYKACLKPLERALSESPRTMHEEIYFMLARAYEHLGRNRKARAYYTILSEGKQYQQEAREKIDQLSR